MKNPWTRLALYLTLFNAVTACGTVSNKDLTIRPPVDNPRAETHQPPEIDAELRDAVNDWLSDCQIYSSLHCGSYLNKIDSIKVVDAYEEGAEDTIGRCQLYQNYTWQIVQRDVTIRRDILTHPYTLRATFAHEMGHCAFLLEHDASEPNLLMNPYVPAEVTLMQKLDWMLTKFYMGLRMGTLPRIGIDNE